MDAKSQDSVHKPQPFRRERRAEAVSNRGPSAYQPTALPLGQTGSRRRIYNFITSYTGTECTQRVAQKSVSCVHIKAIVSGVRIVYDYCRVISPQTAYCL